MGKAKKKKFSAPKQQPTGLPSVADCEAEIELETNNVSAPATLQNIIEKLQSPNEENREGACTTIANFASQPAALTGLLKLNVVKILGPLVLDRSWDVRHRALGALRNLSVDGGAAVCEEMIQKDILTPVLALIQKFSTEAQFTEKHSDLYKTMICEAYANAFYLLLYLCEGSETAVQQFNRENLVPLICAILDSDEYDVNLKLAIGEFLQTVTEENSDLPITGLVECVQRLMSQPNASTNLLLLRTLATGILVNLEGSRLSSAQADLIVPIVTSVGEVLSQSPTNLLCSENGVTVPQAESTAGQGGAGDNNAGATQGASGGTEEEDGMEAEMKDNGEAISEASPTVTNQKCVDIENILKAQKVALEIAANLCCSDDDGWEEVDSGDSSNDDTMEVMEEESGADNFAPLCVSTELHSAYVNCDIVSKVLQAAQPLSEENLQYLNTLTEAQQLQKRFEGKQVHALLCVNNLVSSLDVQALGGVDRLHTVWLGLNQLSTTQACLKNQQLLEAVTSAMRAVTQKLADVDKAKFEAVQPSDVQLMYEMTTKCQWSEVRVNALRIVSTIGTVLAKNTTPHPLLKDIGVFLLEVVSKDTDLWVVAEALDSMFDVFGEDHLDPVVKEIRLVERLKTVAPALKSKMQEQKKHLGEHYPVVTMARTNLIRFIKYKSAR